MTPGKPTDTEAFTVLEGGPSIEEREAQLADGADALVEGRGGRSLAARDTFLLAVAGALMTLGICVVLIGWAGAANTTLLEEQVPYLISGGLLGVAITIIGALTFFSHWLTVSIREARAREADRRRDHAEMMTTLNAIAGALNKQEEQGRARSTRAQRSLR